MSISAAQRPGASIAGSERTLGRARQLVISPITRCAATQVNPVTAERDLDIVAVLERSFGHINMGVCAEVLADGEIAVGDPLLAPPHNSIPIARG
jgi:uncharacterized protein YcbX